MVQVQLGHHIAEGRHVDLVRVQRLFHQGGNGAGLLHQLLLLRRGQVVDLPQVGDPGHQDKPGILAVPGQQDAAEGQIPEDTGIRLQAGMQFEHGGLAGQHGHVGNQRCAHVTATRGKLKGGAQPSR